MREEWKDAAKAIRGKWLTVTAAEAEYDRALTARALFSMIDMVNAFDDAFPRPPKRAERGGFQRFGAFCGAPAVRGGTALRTGRSAVRRLRGDRGG